MGMIYKQEQFDGIKKRMAEVEGRINRFNEEVKGLNEDEEKIIGTLKGKQLISLLPNTGQTRNMVQA